MQQKNKARYITSASWYGHGKYTVTAAGFEWFLCALGRAGNFSCSPYVSKFWLNGLFFNLLSEIKMPASHSHYFLPLPWKLALLL